MTPDGLNPVAFRQLLNRALLAPPILFGFLALVFLGQILYLLSAARWVDHTDQVLSEANLLLRTLVDRETRMRGYLITGDPVFLELHESEEGRAHPDFEGLIELVSDNPIQVERLKALKVTFTKWQAFAQRIMAMRSEGKDFMPLARTLEGKTRMDAIRVQVAEFIRMEEELRETRTRTVRSATGMVLGTSIGLAVLLGGVLALLTRRRLLHVSNIYQVAIAEVKSQAESLQRSAQRLETLHGIDLAILSHETFPEVTRSALRRMEPVVPSAEAFVALFESAEGSAQMIFKDEKRSMILGAELDACSQSTKWDSLQTIPDLDTVAERSPIQERLLASGHHSYVSVPLRTDGIRIGVLVIADPVISKLTEEHAQIACEVAQQLAIAIQQERLRESLKRNADELEQRVRERTQELQESLEAVKQLQGLLPICAWCKKVRDDQNYWHEVEHYVAAHTAARFTHGMCPACFQKNVDALESGM